MFTILTTVLLVPVLVLALFGLACCLGLLLLGSPRLKAIKRSFTLTTAVVHAMALWDEEPLVRQLEGLGVILKTVSLNPASIGAGAAGTATVAVSGLTPAHKCFVAGAGAPSAAVGIFGGRCVAAGTLTADFFNASAGALDLASVSCTLLAFPGELN